VSILESFSRLYCFNRFSSGAEEQIMLDNRWRVTFLVWLTTLTLSEILTVFPLDLKNIRLLSLG
jgi:hypothetical protein